MKKKSKGGRYVTQSTGYGHWLLWGTAVVSLVVIIVVGLWLARKYMPLNQLEQPQSEPSAEETTVIWSTTESATEENDSIDSQTEKYTARLSLYRTALIERWDKGKCIENDISLMISNFVDIPDQLCWLMIDMDGNGVEELIITDGMMIYDLYTRNDDKLVHILTAWERNSYQLCMDNVIYNHGSNGAASSACNFYQVQGETLILVDSVLVDAFADPDNPWFRSNDGMTRSQPISETQAEEILSSYQNISMVGSKIIDME